jgi:hypothetical protein
VFNDIWVCEDLFHTESGVAFADLLVNGHRETWPIRSKRFRGWLRRHYYQATGKAASAAEIRSTLDLMEARAQFDSSERAVHIRLAEHAGRIYLDLADEHWRAVSIGPDGWRVIGCPPVRFRRPAGMLPLPIPETGGSIEDLKSFINVASEDDFVVIIAWLLAALRPHSPYPLLAISGEQGSAKTVLSKLVKALLDPNAAPVRALPREERELMIAAHNGHLLAFDNLSGLPTWVSDALCRLASGGSFALRQLYTDHEEEIFQAARPILLNGIEDVIGRPDLGDRAVFVTLPHIEDTRRRLEAELWHQFKIAHPRILGVLLDVVVHGQQRKGHTAFGGLPRMADFAHWAAACETALWPAGTVAHAYAANRRAAMETIIDSDPVASFVRAMMTGRATWVGSASNLLLLCTQSAANNSAKCGAWTKNPRAFAGRLRRAQTFLRAIGIEITFSREGQAGSRMIRLSTLSESSVSRVSTGSTAPSESAYNISCDGADGTDAKSV